MLPGGRNRPPYRLGQTAGGTGNVVPMTSIYLSCRPFAADRRAGVHARRLGLAALPVGVLSGPKAKRAPAQGAMPAPPRKAFGWCKPSGECPCCLASLAATVMLPGGRNRPPYRSGQTAGGTGNVVPTTSIYLSCRPFAADRRAGVHARRKTFRSMRFFGSMFTFTRKPSASHQPLRKGRGIPAGANAPSARFFEHAPGVRTAEIPHS